VSSTLIASFPTRTSTILIIEIKIIKLLNVFKFYLSLSLGGLWRFFVGVVVWIFFYGLILMGCNESLVVV